MQINSQTVLGVDYDEEEVEVEEEVFDQTEFAEYHNITIWSKMFLQNYFWVSNFS